MKKKENKDAPVARDMWCDAQRIQHLMGIACIELIKLDAEGSLTALNCVRGARDEMLDFIDKYIFDFH